MIPSSLKSALTSEGKRLESIAKKVWQQYLDSYTPVQYKRTGATMESIRLQPVEKVSASEVGIRLVWENGLAYHSSVVGGKSGHAFMLISDGWKAKKLEYKMNRRIYRFTYYEGAGLLYKIYKEYYASKPDNITVEVNWSGSIEK